MANKMFALLCWGLVSAFPSLCAANAAEEAMTLDAGVVLNATQGLVEEHLTGVLTGLKVLAATEETTSGSWDGIKRPLQEFGNHLPTQVALWFGKPDGSYYTLAKGLTDETLKDRAYFPALMSGKDVLGNLVVSKSTGERSIIVATPVVKNGRVIGALGATLSATKLAQIVTDKIGFPDTVVFYALDGNGLTALHRDTALVFQFPSDIGDESLKSAVHDMLSKPKGVVHYTFRGSPRTVRFQKSDLTGWVFALGQVNAR